MEPKQIELDARKMAKRVTVKLRIVHEREMRVRSRVGMWFIWMASKIMLSRIAVEVIAPKPDRVHKTCR
jgi:hypothetical protein